MTRKTYCGNLLWQSSLTLLPRDDAEIRAYVAEGRYSVDEIVKRAASSVVSVCPHLKRRETEAAYRSTLEWRAHALFTKCAN